jgi:hypothetical protein
VHHPLPLSLLLILFALVPCTRAMHLCHALVPCRRGWWLPSVLCVPWGIRLVLHDGAFCFVRIELRLSRAAFWECVGIFLRTVFIFLQVYSAQAFLCTPFVVSCQVCSAQAFLCAPYVVSCLVYSAQGNCYQSGKSTACPHYLKADASVITRTWVTRTLQFTPWSLEPGGLLLHDNQNLEQ